MIKPITHHQLITLLLMAEQEFLQDLDALAEDPENVRTSGPLGNHAVLHSVWMELGRCKRDLIGAQIPTLNTSARSALERHGYLHHNIHGFSRYPGLRYELTEKGREYLVQLTSATMLFRRLARGVNWWD